MPNARKDPNATILAAVASLGGGATVADTQDVKIAQAIKLLAEQVIALNAGGSAPDGGADSHYQIVSTSGIVAPNEYNTPPLPPAGTKRAFYYYNGSFQTNTWFNFAPLINAGVREIGFSWDNSGDNANFFAFRNGEGQQGWGFDTFSVGFGSVTFGYDEDEDFLFIANIGAAGSQGGSAVNITNVQQLLITP